MKIGFVVNALETEQAKYTTTRLANAAHNRGHEAWVFGVGDFEFDGDERIWAKARRAPRLDRVGRAAPVGDGYGARQGHSQMSLVQSPPG